MKIRFSRNFTIGNWDLALIYLLVLHFVVNLFWILTNNAPALWDSSNHTYISILISEKIKNLDPVGILYTSNYYPILIHLLTALPLTIFGYSIKLAQFAGTIYLLLTLSIIYIYIKQTTKSGRIAFLVVAFFSFMPVIFDQSRQLMLDIPSVGILFLCLYFLDKSEFLKNRKYTILAALAAGLLAMTKWTPLLYLVVPGIFTLFKFFKSGSKVAKIKNLFLGLLVFAVVALPWYGANFKDILFLTEIYGEGDPKAHPQIFLSAENFVTYFKIFLYTQATPLPALVFLAGLVAYPFINIRTSSLFNSKWFVIFMIAVNYLFFTAILNKDGRFTIHLLVFTSLITAYFFEFLIERWKLVGILLLSCYLGFLIFYYFLLTIRPVAWEGYKLSKSVPLLGGLEFINVDDSLVKKIDSRVWKMDELISDLKKINNGSEIRILVVSEWAHFNPSNIRTYTKVAGLGNIIPVTPDLPYLRVRYQNDHFPSDAELKNFIAKDQYLLISPGNIGSPYLLNMKAMDQLQSFAFPEDFPSCSRFRSEISVPNTKCFVKAGEVLTTTSDISIDDKPVQKGNKTVKGFAQVVCPFGCSFEFVKKTEGEDNVGPRLDLLKTYTLPNGQKTQLFRINVSQTNTNLIN